NMTTCGIKDLMIALITQEYKPYSTKEQCHITEPFQRHSQFLIHSVNLFNCNSAAKVMVFVEKRQIIDDN
ncbi:MAG: hypothetical protein IJ928_02310, partial [Prevotella sp.]|nr:hypothetical protein [Prevotella sp.]